MSGFSRFLSSSPTQLVAFSESSHGVLNPLLADSVFCGPCDALSILPESDIDDPSLAIVLSSGWTKYQSRILNSEEANREIVSKTVVSFARWKSK